MLIYDRALSESEQSLVGRYLAARYDIRSTYQPAPGEILEIAVLGPEQRSVEQRGKLFEFFVAEIHPPSRDTLKRLADEVTRLDQERDTPSGAGSADPVATIRTATTQVPPASWTATASPTAPAPKTATGSAPISPASR